MAKDRLTSSPLGDFFAFRTMITPVIIQLLFWMGSIASLVAGGLMIANAYYYGSETEIILGIFTIIFGPLAVRIWCEIMILFFRMNQTLTEIKNKR